MALNYDADERKNLAEAVRKGKRPDCPTCGATLATHEVPPSRDVAYVRHRVWLICPRCKRTAAVDVRRDESD